MEQKDEAIIKSLLKESEGFRREQETHQRYEKILEEFNRRPHLTTDESLERKKVQKLKLACKDRMERMIFEQRQARVGTGGGTGGA